MSHSDLNKNEISASELKSMLVKMKNSRIGRPPPPPEIRISRINRAIDLLVDNQNALTGAVDADFGNRSTSQTLLADVGSAVAALKYSRDNLNDWMKPESVPAPFPGTSAGIEYQPLGVVGIVSPWNFPITLAFSPLAGAFAAGNTVMLKPSELTPTLSALIGNLVPRYFSSDEFSVVLGGPDVGAAFVALPFDHLIFTGSTPVARHVMRAAADNLVPVTLELGGKSPVIISRTADVRASAQRVMTVKTLNAGQICLSPDYILLPENSQDSFVDFTTEAVAAMYPTLRDNKDYTSIINERNFARLHHYLDDARAKGGRIIEINPACEDLENTEIRKFAPTLVLDATEDMKVMQEEIFGPILPIKTYRDFNQVISEINARSRPLATYYFGENHEEQRSVIELTMSGAVVINDAMTHVFADELPFGGVGLSGMGAYHGIYGFRAFSHARSILVQSIGGESNLPMRAPYGELAQTVIKQMLAKHN